MHRINLEKLGDKNLMGDILHLQFWLSENPIKFSEKDCVFAGEVFVDWKQAVNTPNTWVDFMLPLLEDTKSAHENVKVQGEVCVQVRYSSSEDSIREESNGYQVKQGILLLLVVRGVFEFGGGLFYILCLKMAMEHHVN